MDPFTSPHSKAKPASRGAVFLALCLWLISSVILVPSQTMAQDLSSPEAITLPALQSAASLEILGPSGTPVTYDLSKLESLGLYRVKTSTFWPSDDGIYEGALLADILDAAGLADAPAVKVSARDGFSQVIPRAHWTRWPMMLATRRDGKAMSLRQKGPFRIIYPRDSDPELEDLKFRLRWVWMVDRIEAHEPE